MLLKIQFAKSPYLCRHSRQRQLVRYPWSMSNSFRAPASILKNARKRPFLYGRGHQSPHCTCLVLRYERHTIRQANLSSVEWRLPHVAATVRRRAIGPGSERRWPVFDYYIYDDAILNRPCLLGCPINPPPPGGGGRIRPPPRFFWNNFFFYYCIDMKLGTPLRASIWRRLVKRKSKSAEIFLL